MQLELLSYPPADANETCTINVNTLKAYMISIEIWIVYYDRSKTHDGAGAGYLLVDPKKNKFLISCRLEFQCTNNTAEYEVLILGLKKSIALKAEYLKLISDSEIITRQVWNLIHSLSPRPKNYQQEVWRLICSFKVFNINYVPRFNNVAADTLANAATRFTPLRGGFSIEIIYKPVVPDNVTNLRVFNDDQ